jgi:hypothetical protein
MPDDSLQYDLAERLRGAGLSLRKPLAVNIVQSPLGILQI